MIRLVFLILFFYSTFSHSTEYITEVLGSYTNNYTVHPDLNLAYTACISEKLADEVCLWYAQGDVLQMTSTNLQYDFRVTITAPDIGWYKLKHNILFDDSALEFPLSSEVYNNASFDFFTSLKVYTATLVAPANGKEDFIGRYEGFRDYSFCPDQSDLTFYPDYTGRQIDGDNTGNLSNIGFSEHSDSWDGTSLRTYSYYDSQNYQSTAVTYCTDPTPTGLSCEVKSNLGISHTINNNSFNLTAYHLVFTVNITQTTCSGLNDRTAFPARIFLTGETEPLTTYPKFPDLVRISPLFNTIDDNLAQTGYSIPNNYDELFLPSPIVPVDTDGDGNPDATDPCPTDPLDECLTVDTDGDGVPDVSDAFPNDPTETVDSDNDGTGDNSDPFPNDPTDGGTQVDPNLDTDGDGTPDVSDPCPTDPLDQCTVVDSDGDGNPDSSDPCPTDPLDSCVGTSDSSGSCDVAPICTGTAIECATIMQIWQSACINYDDSVQPEHALEISDFDLTAQTFSTRIENSPIAVSFSNVANLINVGVGTCPVFAFEFPFPTPHTIATTIHCELFDSVASLLNIVTLAVYTFLGFRIVASA